KYKGAAMPVTKSLNTEAAIWSRLVESDRPQFSPEAARHILEIDFAPKDRDRMNALAAKAREGTLSPQEDEELTSYIHVGHLLGILKSKARQSLKPRANGR